MSDTAHALKRIRTRRRLFRTLKKWISKLRFLLFAVGICWLFILPSEQYHKSTYISENALLPGQVNTYYSWGQVHEAAAFRDNITLLSNSSNIEKAAYIENELRKAGLKTAMQNFTFNMSGKKISGINVYGVFKAPRADGTEALVLSAPWKSNDGETINTNGIAAALSIGKFFKGYTYWSKDIILLITDGGEAGVQAWLESYHDHPRSAISSTPLFLRSGAIQAAINLDFPSTNDYKALGIFFEGVNGQLPNLDLINTVIRVCRSSYSIPIMLHDSGHHYSNYDNGNYYDSLHNLLQTMRHQALCHPTGSHGLFFRYKIDAITLYGHTTAQTSNSFSFIEIGSIVESTFRSLNNLLEHLHQSFFFYLLPTPERYISIGSYLPPALLLTVGLILQISFMIMLKNHKDDNYVVPLPYNNRQRQILFPMTVLIVSHFAGLLIFFVITNHFSYNQLSKIFGIPEFLFTLSLITSISILIPATLIQIQKSDWMVLKSFTLAFTAMIMSCLSVLNFSLAVFSSLIVIIPFSLFKPTPKYKLLQYLQLLVLIMISPPGILILSGTNLEKFLRWALMEYELLGSYLLPFICCFYWPSILVYSSRIGPIDNRLVEYKMNTVKRSTELPLISLDNIGINSTDQDEGRQISKEKQHQICLNFIFMLGMSQGINEEEISKILSSNLKVLDSFENIIGTILNKMVKYKSNENKKFQSSNKVDRLNQSSKNVEESTILPLVMYESDYDSETVKISDEKNIVNSDIENMDTSDEEEEYIESDTDIEDIIELDENFLIEKETKENTLINTEHNNNEKRTSQNCNTVEITKPKNIDRLIITKDDNPPRFKLFCKYIKTPEFKNHAMSLRLPPLPEIRDVIIRGIAKGRNEYPMQWNRYEFLGNRVLKLFISKIVLEHFKLIFNQSLENVINFLNSNKLFAAYCMCLNLHEDNHISQDACCKTYSNAFKAYFGGLYLSQGESGVTEYLTKLLMPLLYNLANYQSKIKPRILCDKLLGKITGEYFDMEWLI
ncbi:Gaa1p [Rhizophagus irregularis DAOM 197198w]|uniref:Gaa1p n=1 Tax=Rhizophagus irregularis (strain DAOM 197198w) TaxID=1432141 RepID=A0A015LA80_RHIIW|nr:Gaa1p [Rhizophagus irregularis DAOM 197198w]